MCPVDPAHTVVYVGRSVSPPVYPTRTCLAPFRALNVASGPQNHPLANTASSHPSGILNPSPLCVRASDPEALALDRAVVCARMRFTAREDVAATTVPDARMVARVGE